MVVKAPDVTYLWRRKAPFERGKREVLGGSGGTLPQEIFEKEHSETLFPGFLETSLVAQLISIHSKFSGSTTLV